MPVLALERSWQRSNAAATVADTSPKMASSEI